MPQAHILVADDDDITLDMLEAALSGHYRVSTAKDGQRALQLAAQHPVDLVLLDVEMPGLDGYATCLSLRSQAQTSDLPVIFLSARVTLEERLRGYQVGANDYLTKPFDVSELITKIELAVSQRERNRHLSSEIKEAKNSVIATANLYGEMGVVFELQRQLPSCKTYPDICRTFFDALSKLGLEGCMRLSGRQGVVSLTGAAECSALENSILDHIESKSRHPMEALGEHTCIRHSNVLMLIRQLPLHPDSSLYSTGEIDRMGRLRDNLTLMSESIVSHLHTLDAMLGQQDLSRTRDIIRLTRETLSDLAAQQHATRMQLAQILRAMTTEVEQSFIHLGLSPVQEDQLTNTLNKHVTEVMGVVNQVDEIETHLEQLVRKIQS